jgi:serine/threonine-protein kinase
VPAQAAERYAELWQGDGQPDLDGFLASAGELSADDLAAVLRVDQSRRWERGERPGAEDYLRRYPRVAEDEGAALDLIHHEFLMRERQGERPTLDEYLGRFPQYAAAIHTQIELHLALETSVDREGDRPVSRGEGTDVPATAGGCDDEVAPPEVFGRYRIRERIGRGGMGTVYLAYDTQLERRVALKVIRFGDDPGGQLVRRFLREARIAASFTDPHLCPIHDVGEQDGLPYLTMPLLEGESLAVRLGRDGPLPPREAVRLAVRIARALAVAHRAGVIHRDVKPANVMIDGRGEPIVLDFGLARRAAPDDPVSTHRGALLGTPAYMAPEQIGGDPTAVGASCDIYGLGVMLSQMLTGRVPFHGPAHEIFRQALTRTPDPPSRLRPEVGSGLDRICLTALAKRPGDRFATMDAFADALEAEWEEGRPAPRPIAARSRRRVAWIAGLSVLVALSGATAWLMRASGMWTAAGTEGRDPLAAGSVWSGTFLFRPPITEYRGDVQVAILERRPGWFLGRYTTENGRYEWEIQGGDEAGSIRWVFTRAIKDNPDGSVVGRARVEGRIEGPIMRVVFSKPGDGVADMTLTPSGQ